MERAQLGHGVVADARQLEPDRTRGKVLDRRVRQRDDLAVVAELVHLAEALVEIEQLFHAPQPRRDIAEPRRDAVHLLEELLRSDMTIDVDDRIVGHRAPPLQQEPSSRPRKRASSKHQYPNGNAAVLCTSFDDYWIARLRGR